MNKILLLFVLVSTPFLHGVPQEVNGPLDVCPGTLAEYTYSCPGCTHIWGTWKVVGGEVISQTFPNASTAYVVVIWGEELDGSELVLEDSNGTVAFEDIKKASAEDCSFSRPNNRIIRTTYHAAGGNHPSQSFEYFDGIGQTTQTVQARFSPTRKDIIQSVKYDLHGRLIQQYLPYTIRSTSPGDFQASFLQDQALFYDELFGEAAGSFAFTQYKYEKSPLDRKIASYAPGRDWSLSGENRPLKTEHLAITSNEVRYWQLNSAGLPYLNSNASHYKIGALHKVMHTDEDGKKTIAYTDLAGRLLLKKVQAAPSPSHNTEAGWANTYYIYDDYGLLRVVLPPEATARIDTEFLGQGASSQKAFLKRWAFQYRYDRRNRMITKQVPGADMVKMIYDDRDRLVLTQDGEQRKSAKWFFTKYDALNRPIITGEKVFPSTENELRASLSRTHWEQNYAAYETLGGGAFGYTSQGFPKNISYEEVLTVTYYDSYAFRDDLAEFGSAFSYQKPNHRAGGIRTPQGTYDYETSVLGSVKGQITGSQVKVLGTNEWARTVNYYDPHYRLIQTVIQNTYHGLTERTSQLYNFPGWVLETFKEQDLPGNALAVQKRHVYDHAGRLTGAYHELYENGNGQGEVLLSKNEYNELGELIGKNLHSEDQGQTFHQSVDYQYNIRGWLRTINEIEPPGAPNLPAPADLFNMELIYNTTNSGLPNN